MKYDYQEHNYQDKIRLPEKKDGGVRNSVFMLPICDNMHNTIHTRARAYSSTPPASYPGVVRTASATPLRKPPNPDGVRGTGPLWTAKAGPMGMGGSPCSPNLVAPLHVLLTR